MGTYDGEDTAVPANSTPNAPSPVLGLYPVRLSYAMSDTQFALREGRISFSTSCLKGSDTL